MLEFEKIVKKIGKYKYKYNKQKKNIYLEKINIYKTLLNKFQIGNGSEILTGKNE